MWVPNSAGCAGRSNFTLDQLASTSGVDRGTISRIELGHVSPRIDTISFLCEAMGASLSQFFGSPDAAGEEPLDEHAAGRPGPGAAAPGPPAVPGVGGPVPRTAYGRAPTDRGARRLLAHDVPLLARHAGSAGPLRGAGEEQQRADPGPGPGGHASCTPPRPAGHPGPARPGPGGPPAPDPGAPRRPGAPGRALRRPGARSHRPPGLPPAPQGRDLALAGRQVQQPAGQPQRRRPGVSTPWRSRGPPPREPVPSCYHPGPVGGMGASLANRTFQVGLVQMACGPDPDANLGSALDQGRRGRGPGRPGGVPAGTVPDPVFLPAGGPCPVRPGRAHPRARPAERLGEAARRHGVVLVGSLFERRAPGVYHNTAVLFDADGTLLRPLPQDAHPRRPPLLREVLLHPRRPGLPRHGHPGRAGSAPWCAGTSGSRKGPGSPPWPGRRCCSTPPPSAGTPGEGRVRRRPARRLADRAARPRHRQRGLRGAR